MKDGFIQLCVDTVVIDHTFEQISIREGLTEEGLYPVWVVSSEEGRIAVFDGLEFIA